MRAPQLLKPTSKGGGKFEKVPKPQRQYIHMKLSDAVRMVTIFSDHGITNSPENNNKDSTNIAANTTNTNTTDSSEVEKDSRLVIQGEDQKWTGVTDLIECEDKWRTLFDTVTINDNDTVKLTATPLRHNKRHAYSFFPCSDKGMRCRFQQTYSHTFLTHFFFVHVRA